MSDLPFQGKVPKMDVIYMTRKQEKRPVTPDCERVSVPVPCETCTLQHRYVERCSYHGCAWPDGEKECPSR